VSDADDERLISMFDTAIRNQCGPLAPKSKSLALFSKIDSKIDTSYRLYKSALSMRSMCIGGPRMDATWCFLLGMIAGSIPPFAVLTIIVFGS
jgi:hypothetical protein